VDDETRCILLFASVHDVAAAERVLIQHGVWCDVVPKPSVLGGGCGVALVVQKSDMPRLGDLPGFPVARLQGAYRKVDGAYLPC
jgi:hypothetical protein